MGNTIGKTYCQRCHDEGHLKPLSDGRTASPRSPILLSSVIEAFVDPNALFANISVLEQPRLANTSDLISLYSAWLMPIIITYVHFGGNKARISFCLLGGGHERCVLQPETHILSVTWIKISTAIEDCALLQLSVLFRS